MEETPFMSNIGRETVTNTLFEFQTDVLAAAAANAQLEGDDVATFDEKFKFEDGRVRKQQQMLYMEDTSTIVNAAQDAGFILQGKIDLVKCAYEYQYLYLIVNLNYLNLELDHLHHKFSQLSLDSFL